MDERKELAEKILDIVNRKSPRLQLEGLELRVCAKCGKRLPRFTPAVFAHPALRAPSDPVRVSRRRRERQKLKTACGEGVLDVS